MNVMKSCGSKLCISESAAAHRLAIIKYWKHSEFPRRSLSFWLLLFLVFNKQRINLKLPLSEFNDCFATLLVGVLKNSWIFVCIDEIDTTHETKPLHLF